MSPNRAPTRNLKNLPQTLANNTTRDQLSPDIGRPVQKSRPMRRKILKSAGWIAPFTTRKTGGLRGQPDSPAQATELKKDKDQKDKDKKAGWIGRMRSTFTPRKTGGLKGKPDSPAQATTKEDKNTKNTKGPKSTR
ncbi:hypothetical protein J132_08403 [Termitomyces sp. J132]|nr:hypothetical protein J132_08403 [Termitomyces sp. J132]